MNIVSPEKPVISQLSIDDNESWCFYGSMDSGIEDFFNLLSGVHSPLQDAGIISFDLLQKIYEEEIRNDDSDFLDYPDPGTLVREFLPAGAENHSIVTKLGMAHLFDTGFRRLSSGQSRKLLLLKEILCGRKELIIYMPYDGLDHASCRELDKSLKELAKHMLLIILVNNRADIPSWCSHLGIFVEGQLQNAGPAHEITPLLPDVAVDSSELAIESESKALGEILVDLKNGFAGYGELQLFEGLDLTIRSGEHTLVTGPNGCGKSTLLHIITGDHPACYSNNLQVFGIKRGTGESIWDIKRDMGIVSPELHRNHRCPGSGIDIVIGGFFDSIGLYRKAKPNEIQLARKWLIWLGLAQCEKKPFRNLSFAEQRLILIARGLIKMPKLLILDEPTQGLDEEYRLRLLQLMEKIAEEKLSTILFVSHRQDEYRAFFTQHLALEQFATDKGEIGK